MLLMLVCIKAAPGFYYYSVCLPGYNPKQLSLRLNGMLRTVKGGCFPQETATPELEWLDAPPAGRLEAATKLLQNLGAINAGGRITPEGAECSEPCKNMLAIKSICSLLSAPTCSQAGLHLNVPSRLCRVRLEGH